MLNLLVGFLNVLIGYLLMIQYGNERAKSGQRKYWDWLLVLACLDIIAAGLNIGKIAERFVR